MRGVALFVLAGALALAMPQRAEACDCFVDTYKDAFRSADRVALVRVTEVAGDDVKADVLRHFKGKRVKELKFEQDDNPLCGREFEKDEVAFVFLFDGVAVPCSGNHPMAYQLHFLADIAHGAKLKVRSAKFGPVAEALWAALHPFVGNVKLRVQLPAYSKKSWTKGKFKLTFAKSAEVIVEKSIRVGDLTHVRGTYHDKGVRFSALVRTSKKSTEVLFATVAKEYLPPKPAP